LDSFRTITEPCAADIKVKGSVQGLLASNAIHGELFQPIGLYQTSFVERICQSPAVEMIERNQEAT